MDVKKFSGVIPAVITPFDAEGEVDEEKLVKYIKYLVDNVDGLFVAGSYGSGPLMSLEQRRTVAELTLSVSKGKCPTIVHVGYPNTKSTIDLALHAQANGADAVAAVTPFYYLHKRESIKAYYIDLINSVDIPILLYNNPKYSNFCVDGDLLAELADEGLQGVKDSSNNIPLFYDFMAKVKKDDFLFLIGSQTNLLPAVVGGAHGCVSGLSNAFPKFVREIYDESVSGNFKRARDLQLKANLLRAVTGEGIPIPFYHAVLPMMDIDIGLPKSPFLPLDDEEVKRIRKTLEETKMIM